MEIFRFLMNLKSECFLYLDLIVHIDKDRNLNQRFRLEISSDEICEIENQKGPSSTSSEVAVAYFLRSSLIRMEQNFGPHMLQNLADLNVS